MTRKLRRRLRIIAARAALCAVAISALGFTGYSSTPQDGDTPDAQVASLSR